MKLKHYLVINEIKVKDLAKKVGCHPQLISSYMNKKARISLRTARLLAMALDNAYTEEQLLAENASPRPKKTKKTEKPEKQSEEEQQPLP